LSENEFKDRFNLSVYGKGKIPSAGDTLLSKGEIKKLVGKRNPGDFDFRSHFSRQGKYGRLFIDKKHDSIILKGKLPFFIRWIRSSRDFVRNSVNNATDSKTAGLLTALLLGDKSSIDEDLKRDFANTGVIHVLAVSGLHVGYILIILTIFTSIIRIPWGWNRVVIILGLIAFCALTGGKPSVIRAAIMAGLYVFTPIVNRPGNIWNIIGFAGCLLLSYDPLYIKDLGFILSFSAVISIIYFYGLFEKLLPESINPKYIQNAFIKYTLSLFLVSLSAQIGTLPITAAYFHKIPIISLIANVMIVPIVGIIVVIGFMILGLSFSPFFSELAGNVAWLLQTIISWLAKFFSSFSFSSIPVAQIEFIDVALYGLIILGLFLIFQKESRGKGLIAFLFIANVMIWGNAPKPVTNILFMDVGQGDAALIKFSNGKTMLVDAGNRNRREDWGGRVVIPVLNHLGIQKLDWTVMSHPHADHIGGLVSVVEEFPTDTLLDTYSGYGSWTYNHLIERYTALPTIIKKPKTGEILEITPMESIHFLAPDSIFSVSQRNVNNASIVFKLIVGDNSFLFTGDLEHEGDDALIQFGDHLQVDVLKIGHHGSITSTREKLLTIIDPELAVVSVGEGNKFSHPSPVVMERLEDHQIEIHRTDYSGALWLQSDGNSYWKKSWK
ncbi:MAG TPA: DNA internalization-related competence protein ComEC/Rec2, partial [Candidatus Marinimicrobia bacterium]|nr:DNA internalization-related competence protein ComEC/Rec2 [Candidatus Neomarinimicrobiota bacterium]